MTPIEGTKERCVALELELAEVKDPGQRIRLIARWLCPPEPQLLDTSVLQNLDWVDRKMEDPDVILPWEEKGIASLQRQYGTELATDLIDLGTLYKQFEHYGSYPWLVCDVAVEEASVLKSEKGRRLRKLIEFLSGHQEQMSGDAYPGVASGLLLAKEGARVSPLILKALGVQNRDEVSEPGGPLGFLPDDGDRRLAAQALLANIPVILTSDRRTFWNRRSELSKLGVDVMRPSELLAVYWPYWDALEREFRFRRS